MNAGIDEIERMGMFRSLFSELHRVRSDDGKKAFEQDKSSDWDVWLANARIVNSIFDDLNDFLGNSYIRQMYVFMDDQENGRRVWRSVRVDPLKSDELASLLMEQDILGREIVAVARNISRHDSHYGCVFLALAGRFEDGNSTMSNTISEYLPKLCEVIER